MSNSFCLDRGRIEYARAHYQKFINSCISSDGRFCLTPLADSSSYALCFAIYGYHLIKAVSVLDSHRSHWTLELRKGLIAQKLNRERLVALSGDKAYLQLLTFTLSALSILETLGDDSLSDLVIEILPKDIESALINAGCLQGASRSGNQAMFLAVLLLYSRDFLGLKTQANIDSWIALHKGSMNQFGFWGKQKTMSHLQFQNGYHQYEILEYLHVDDVPWNAAADAVALLADPAGHFAPYPGGGACYDYDAVFILTATRESTEKHSALLMKTAQSILGEQNPDGGFCESKSIRPRSLSNFIQSFSHAFNANGSARIERLRWALTLQRYKHNRIHTHWSTYSRKWDESDLWDSWFRMLALARIDCAFDSSRSNEWGFINFPGIGFHPSLHIVRAR